MSPLRELVALLKERARPNGTLSLNAEQTALLFGWLDRTVSLTEQQQSLITDLADIAGVPVPEGYSLPRGGGSSGTDGGGAQ